MWFSKPFPDMPLFRKLPEIMKFLIERKNFWKNETVSLDKKKIILKGKRFWGKRTIYPNSLNNNKNGNLFYNNLVPLKTVVQLSAS